jgi:hypothetical protein
MRSPFWSGCVVRTNENRVKGTPEFYRKLKLPLGIFWFTRRAFHNPPRSSAFIEAVPIAVLPIDTHALPDQNNNQDHERAVE